MRRICHKIWRSFEVKCAVPILTLLTSKAMSGIRGVRILVLLEWRCSDVYACYGTETLRFDLPLINSKRKQCHPIVYKQSRTFPPKEDLPYQCPRWVQKHYSVPIITYSSRVDKSISDLKTQIENSRDLEESEQNRSRTPSSFWWGQSKIFSMSYKDKTYWQIQKYLVFATSLYHVWSRVYNST